MQAADLSYRVDYPHFPELRKIDLREVDASLVSTLEDFRSTTGIPMIPSPLQGGWWRITGSETSRHYAKGRLSDAGDLFPKRGMALNAWMSALQYPAFGGVGIYVDTTGPDGKPWPMLHVDLRPREPGMKILWVRDGEYYYSYQKKFWDIINKIRRNNR